MRLLKALSAMLSILLSGCLSVALVERADEAVAAGSLRGISRSQGCPDAILYEFASEDGDPESRAFLVPEDWLNLRRMSSTLEDGSVLVGLAKPIPCLLVQMSEEATGDSMWIDHRLTLGYAVTPEDVGRDPSGALLSASIYGIARSEREQNGVPHAIHELYGYDPTDYRWVRLGEVDLGAIRSKVPAKVVAAVFFLPLLALDFAAILVVASLFI